eukprot:9275027-Heterocapsa_arctica.AAC.1
MERAKDLDIFPSRSRSWQLLPGAPCASPADFTSDEDPQGTPVPSADCGPASRAAAPPPEQGSPGGLHEWDTSSSTVTRT